MLGMEENIEWSNISREIEMLAMSNLDNRVSWSLEASGQFSTRSVYIKLCHGSVLVHF